MERLIVAPGNPGMRDVASVTPRVSASDAERIAELCGRERVDLVLIGPEAPLVAGIADALAGRGVLVFGPRADAAALEGSKAFCRSVAEAAGVPMADGVACDDPTDAIAAVRGFGGRVVIKADGLAAGKGVTVCDSRDQAEAAIRAAMVGGVFGTAGRRVVVERALDGREASVIAICDATGALALPAARDHKRIFDGDRGPNTGGMGAYSPLEDLSDDDVAAIVERVHLPVLAELARRGTSFRGALYAGLMLTADGPRLLEFNVRFGDPETQAILPRLDVPLGALLGAAAHDRLAGVGRVARDPGHGSPCSTGGGGRRRVGRARLPRDAAARRVNRRDRGGAGSRSARLLRRRGGGHGLGTDRDRRRPRRSGSRDNPGPDTRERGRPRARGRRHRPRCSLCRRVGVRFGRSDPIRRSTDAR